jgi:flagellar protein FliO/FliZ
MGSELFWAVVRLCVCLPLVVGLIYIFLRYGLSRKLLLGRAGRYIKVIEQVPLGPKTTVSLVKIGHKAYLCGHGEGAVAILKELDEEFPDEVEQTVAGFDQVFTAKVRQMMMRRR